MNLTINQSNLLHALLDKYENSKTYEGTNAVSQNFAVKPEKVWKEYVSDFANVAQVKDFETEMQVLQEQGLIRIYKKDEVITKLAACKEKLDVYYELLDRKQKKDMIQEQIAFFERWMQKGLADDIQITDDVGRISVADNAEQVRIAEVADDTGETGIGEVVDNAEQAGIAEVVNDAKQSEIVEFADEPEQAGIAEVADDTEQKKYAVSDMFCRDQLAKVEAGGKPDYELDVCDKLLRILEFICTNKEEILERELSMMILDGSKEFEDHYRTRVCKVLSKYLDFSELLEGIDDTRERQKIILEEFQIYTNPSYIYLKGNIEIQLENGQRIRIGDAPIALSSELIQKMNAIRVGADKVVTVENLTSFHRLKDEKCAYLFLAGYHNSAKQAFLKQVYKENPEKQWFHFGDLDPDGFYILKHLRKGTGIDFMPLYMGVSELETYSGYGRELSETDKVKTRNLLKKGFYAEVMQYMLEHDCKLEQEIISYEIMKKNL